MLPGENLGLLYCTLWSLIPPNSVASPHIATLCLQASKQQPANSSTEQAAACRPSSQDADDDVVSQVQIQFRLTCQQFSFFISLPLFFSRFTKTLQCSCINFNNVTMYLKEKVKSYLLNSALVVRPLLRCGHDGLHGATAAAATTPSLIS